MSQTTSTRSSAPAVGGDVAQHMLSSGQNPRIDPSLPSSDERTLSWRDAMARAEEGVNAMPPAASPNADPIAAAAASSPPDAAAGEWSPMNPRGGAPVKAAEDPGAMSPGARTGEEAAVDGAADGGRAFEWAGGLSDGTAHMSPEALLQLKRDRLAMGLEPGAMPGQGPAVDPGARPDDPLGAAPEICLAQPVSLLQPQGVGVHALPDNERAVVDGMTVGELVVERQVEGERADAHAEDVGAQVAAVQAHLAEVNTPDSLPLETIQSN